MSIRKKISNLSYGLQHLILSLSLASFATSSDLLFFRSRSTLKDHCAVRISRTKKLHIWLVLSDNSANSISIILKIGPKLSVLLAKNEILIFLPNFLTNFLTNFLHNFLSKICPRIFVNKRMRSYGIRMFFQVGSLASLATINKV